MRYTLHNFFKMFAVRGTFQAEDDERIANYSENLRSKPFFGRIYELPIATTFIHLNSMFNCSCVCTKSLEFFQQFHGPTQRLTLTSKLIGIGWKTKKRDGQGDGPSHCS